MEFSVFTKLDPIFITAISAHNNHRKATKKYFEDDKWGAVRFGMFSTSFTMEGSNLENTYYFVNPNSSR